MDFPFNSVNDFLKQANGAKGGQRQAIDERLEPLLNDEATFAIPPSSTIPLEESVEKWGDEALKQMAVVATGKWVQYHQEILNEHIASEDFQAALLTMADLTKIGQAIQLLSSVGSFGGEEDYLEAMRQQIGQAVLEHIEETGRSIDDVFDDPLR